MPYLSVRTEKSPSGQRLEVKGIAVMGRDKSCDVFLDDKQASRQHARVFSDGKQFFVEDLASRNGTLVNGGKIKGRYPLQHGDEIRIGNHFLKFEDERPLAAGDRALPPKRPSMALVEARDTVSSAFASFFMFIVSVLIFGATAVVSSLVFQMLLGGKE